MKLRSSLLLLLLAAPVFAGVPDAAAYRQARALHDRFIALDTHFDTAANLAKPGWSVADRHTVASGSQVDLPRMKEGGIDGGWWTIYTGQGDRTPAAHAEVRDRALLIGLRIHKMVAANSDQMEIALTADDAKRIADAGKSIVYLSMENSYPIGKDLTLVKTFYDLGVRMIGPVHGRNNEMADSATDAGGPEWGGLSPLGKQLVAEANRLGMIIDASHAADSVLDQILDLSATPIVLSHSGAKAVFDHPRNAPDVLLQKLAAKGGVIQMNAFGAYVAKIESSPERNAAQAELFARFGIAGRGGMNTLSAERMVDFQAARAELEKKFPTPRAPFDAFMAQVLHVLKLVGPDHVGMSGDFDGGGGLEGFMDVTGAPNITAALLAAGYTEADLAKIWGGNVIRLLRSAEEHARKKSAPAN
jgi:membrane dipeptidase